MNCLLTTLNSQYVHANLALRYLAAAWRADGGDPAALRLMEFTVNQSDDEIYAELIRADCRLVAFSCYVWNVERIRYLAENLKKARPDTLILLGGPEAASRAEELLRHDRFIDFVLAGEGEIGFPELFSLLRRRESGKTLFGALSEEPGNLLSLADKPDAVAFLDVPGLYYRDGDRVRLPRETWPYREEADWPFPYADERFWDDRIIYYESARGCHGRCAFCLSSIEKTVRPRPLELVYKELGLFLGGRVRQVKFVDRTFNFDEERARQLFRYLMENDNHITGFHFEICGDRLSEDTLALLSTARPGLFQFEIGVQSTHPPTLAAVGRAMDIARLAENVRTIRKAGNIHVHLDLIAGLPYEDYDRFRASFNEVYGWGAEHLQIGFLKLLPGTALQRRAAEFGYVWRRRAPYEIIANRYLSAEGLVRLKAVETVFELYHNRGGFQRSLDYAIGRADRADPFGFFEELATFYHLKGHHRRSHSKADLYRILHQYGVWKDRRHPGTGAALESRLGEDLAAFFGSENVADFYRKGWELKR